MTPTLLKTCLNYRVLNILIICKIIQSINSKTDTLTTQHDVINQDTTGPAISLSKLHNQ